MSGIVGYARYKIIDNGLARFARVNKLISSVRKCPFLRFIIVGRGAFVVVFISEVFL